ncbi:GQ68_04631T0 [Komagataella phaffii GS115]|nr:GQ68_04631T0 [Komagataella phaffii GS115]
MLSGYPEPQYSKIPSSPTLNSVTNLEMYKLKADGLASNSILTTDSHGNFVEESTGRKITLRGVNLDATAKLPLNQTTYKPRGKKIFYEGDTVSFVGRPFPLEDAMIHINRIKSYGFNTIRFIITWEAIEHEGPGKYDEDYINYTIELLKIIHDAKGLYVFIDPHQDVWSRFTGGSGAPLWTIYAAGLDPTSFHNTEAAFVQNNSKDPQNYTKMVWTSNYYRLATQTLFTMFFSGKTFFPKCIINGENIQYYLQRHFIASVAHFFSRLKETAPYVLHQTVIGVESMNEPNSGLLGFKDLSKIPDDQQLRIDTTPTVFQSLMTCNDIPCEVDTYYISVFGPRKSGSRLVNEQGEVLWLKNDEADRKYNFKRDPGWKIGHCPYELHGIWDSDALTLMKPDYFAVHPLTGEEVDIDYFINHEFVEHYKEYKAAIRAIDPDIFMFMQPPVMEVPPVLVDSPVIDDKTVNCQHYYDGMSLMFKTWNTKYNIDTLGIMRKRYSNPIFAIVFGEKNIRKSLRSQLGEMKKESRKNLGAKVPVLITETGMPFDMDDKAAFSNGNYTSQTKALDALGYALEGNNLSVTYWTYTSTNCHKWGDRWNNEDFSLWSHDDRAASFDDDRFSLRSNFLYESEDDQTFTTTLSKSKDDFKVVQTREYHRGGGYQSIWNGTRALKAILRPYPVFVNGVVKCCEYDLQGSKFQLTIDSDRVHSSTKALTEIFVPRVIFHPSKIKVSCSSGTFVYLGNDSVQVLRWDHDINAGDQEITIHLSDSDAELSEKVGNSRLRDLLCGCFKSVQNILC